MAITNYIPELWATSLIEAKEENIVLSRLVGRKYESETEILSKGATVNITTVGDPTISAYSGSLTYEDLSDSGQQLLIDQANSFSFKVDDIEKRQAQGDYVSYATRRSGFLLADTMDEFLFSKVDTAAEVGSAIGDETPVTGGVDVNSSNILEQFGEMGVLLDNKNVSRAGRVAIVTPEVYQKLVLAKVVDVTDNNLPFEQRVVSNVAGFQVFMSQNVPKGSVTDNHKCLFGLVNEGMQLVDQINTVEALRLEGSFSDALRGLHVFGAKVTNPDCLGVGFFNIIAEA